MGAVVELLGPSDARARDERDDDELMLLARAGVRSAFDTLVRRHQGRAIETAKKQLGSLDMAKDAAQNTFVELYRYVPRYNPQGKLKPLLYRILLNQCRMVHRSRRRFFDAKQRMAHEPERAPELPDAELIARERRRQIERALLVLSPKLREVVILRYTGELSYEEIAKALDIPLGTVKSRLFEGVRKLRGRLERGDE